MKFAFFIRKHRRTVAFAMVSAAVLFVIISRFYVDDSTNDMIVGYMQGLGWKIENRPTEITHITIPEEFDAVYRAYNAMQKPAGFDLEDYRGKEVTRYSYRVLNHSSSDDVEVVAGIFVYGNTVIAGDISSLDKDGFMHSIADVSNIE